MSINKWGFMIHLSIPTALGLFAATSAVAVTSVSVAVPYLQPIEPTAVATSSAPTPTPTPTETSPVVQGGDSPLSAFGNHDVGNGVMLSELPLGLSALSRPTGATFSYVGTCTGSGPGSGASMTIWGNNGQKKSWGSAGYCNGGMTFATVGLVWSEDTRNSYCYSPLGGASAYRAEVFGQFSEWISIPAEYMQCINGKAPEGPPPPGYVAPEVLAPPVENSSQTSEVQPLETPSPTPTP